MHKPPSPPIAALDTALWSALLFAVWIALSGKLDALHLGMGAVCAVGVALAVRPMLALSPPIVAPATAPLTLSTAGRFLLFMPWLLVQIVAASLQVAAVVLHPRLPISPRVLRLRVELPNPLARLTLANAITLTPGTVTLDVEGDEYLVHALNEASARGLAPEEAEGVMPRRVRRVFVPRWTVA
jgi:multicomponent Na+:H+ antiporter subunit E